MLTIIRNLITTLATLATLVGACPRNSSHVIPHGTTTIPSGAFANCGNLTRVIVPPSVKSIGQGAFYGSGLENIVLPDAVESIGDYAFASCKDLKSASFGRKLKTLGNGAFSGDSSLTTLTFVPASPLGEISRGVFHECSSLKKVKLPGSVKSIGVNAFNGCTSLEAIEFPVGLERIGTNAFEDCAKLTSIDLPTKLTSIQSYAFFDCSSLATVNVNSSSLDVGYNAFSGTQAVCTRVCPNTDGASTHQRQSCTTEGIGMMTCRSSSTPSSSGGASAPTTALPLSVGVIAAIAAIVLGLVVGIIVVIRRRSQQNSDNMKALLTGETAAV